MSITPTVFIQIANSYVHIGPHPTTISMRRYRSNFGASPSVTAFIWNRIKTDLPKSAEPKHLLYALYFLKNYNSEHVNSSVWRCDEKTYRKWQWLILQEISQLKVVRYFTFFHYNSVFNIYHIFTNRYVDFMERSNFFSSINFKYILLCRRY